MRCTTSVFDISSLLTHLRIFFVLCPGRELLALLLSLVGQNLLTCRVETHEAVLWRLLPEFSLMTKNQRRRGSAAVNTCFSLERQGFQS